VRKKPRRLTKSDPGSRPFRRASSPSARCRPAASASHGGQLRQPDISCGEISCRRATSDAMAPGA
jgi:hypothetical protein